MAKNEEYTRRWVRLTRDLETRGGEKFPKGSICHVRYVERGKLALEMKNPDPDNIFGPSHLSIRCVEVWNVELLPDKRPRCTDESCLHLVEEHSAREGGCLRCKKCRWWPGKDAREKLSKDLAAQKGVKPASAFDDEEPD